MVDSGWGTADEPTAAAGTTDDIAAAARTLAGADTLAFGGVGFAGQILPPTAAYQVLADALAERPDVVRRELARLLDEATPAGKAYAATLLARIDPGAARTAWQALTGDRGELSTFSGCLMGRTTLGEYATAQLGHGRP